MSPLRQNMDVSGSQPRDRSASVPPLEVSQFIVDKASPSVRGPYAPPAVAPSQWSRYTNSGTARTVPDADPIYSQGPSHFAGRPDYVKHTRGGSPTDAVPSPSSHDSRDPILALKGLLRREGTGSNTGVSNMLLQFDRVENNLDSTFRRAPGQRADAPPPRLLITAVHAKNSLPKRPPCLRLSRGFHAFRYYTAPFPKTSSILFGTSSILMTGQDSCLVISFSETCGFTRTLCCYRDLPITSWPLMIAPC